MSDQTLTIKLTLDKSLAIQQSREYHAAERQAIKQTADNHRAATKSKVELEKLAMAEILRANREQQQQFLRESRAAAKERQDRLRDQTKAEREAAKEVAKAQAQALAEARRANTEASQALAKRIADENALRVVLTRQQIEERARTELTQKLNRQRIDSAKELLATESRAFKGLDQHSSSALDSLKGLALQYVGLNAAVRAVGAIGDAWHRVSDEQRQAYKEYIEIQKASRVGGAVSGQSAKQYGAETAKLAASSGLTIAQADEFTRQYEGTIPIGKQKKNITDKVAADVKAEGAKYGARLGGDQSTRGELLGILPQFGKIDSVQQAMGKAEAVRMALTEGRGDDGPLTRALLNVAGKNDMVGSIEEQAALVGTTSLSGGPGQADTIALQIARAVRGSTEKQAQALEKNFGIKVGSQEGLEARLEKMIPKLKEIQAKGGDVYSFLRDEVGTPAENIESLIQFLPNYDAFKKRAENARNTANNAGAGVMKENAAFLKTELGQNLQAQAEGEAGAYVQGEKQKGFGALSAKFAALRKSKDPSFWRNLGEGIESKASFIMPGIGLPEENRANEALEKLIRDRGLKMPAEATGIQAGFTPATVQGTAMMETLRQAGVDPYQAVQEELTKALQPLQTIAEESKKQTEELKAMNRPALAPAPPQQGPARP